MKLKKWVLTAASIVLSFVLFTSTAMAQNTGKTETVYAALNNDGSVKNIYVVNWLYGSYTDYGTYEQIKNLSTLSEPVIEGDKISFPDAPGTGGLYYQGMMTGELPLTFDIDYYIDGQAIDANQLAGANGHLKIEVHYAANERCDKTVRDGLMAQVAAVFSSQTASNVRCDGATIVTVGSAVNINAVILPGENGTIVMESDVNNFEMDPMTITLLKGAFSLSGVTESIGELEDGMDDMIDGADELVDGTSSLKDGMKTLAGSVGKLSKGLNSLGASGVLIDDGITQYGAALDKYLSGVKDLKPASAQIRTGLESLAANGASAAEGVADVDGGLSNLLSSSAELKTLAKSLAGSLDASTKMLAEETLAFINAVERMSGGLSSASNGLDDFTAGVSKAAQGLAAFDDGVAQLAENADHIKGGLSDVKSGFAAYKDGVSKSANGISKIYSSLKGLPSDIQDLIDGQIEFKDGIVSAKDGVTQATEHFKDDGQPAVSFASPKNHPDSVQYILTTPGIDIKKAPKAAEQKKEEDFFSRLADLFS